MKNKAVFVDRDGTINIDVHYLDDPDKFTLYPGVGEGLRGLMNRGFKLIVVTNQSGIGRGYFSEARLAEIHERMKSELSRYGVSLNGIYYCPHHPDDHCRCRKPGTELFERAIQEHDIDTLSSFMIGDKILDIEAGQKSGVKTVLVPEPHRREDCLAKKHLWKTQPDFIAENFSHAVTWIITRGA